MSIAKWVWWVVWVAASLPAAGVLWWADASPSTREGGWALGLLMWAVIGGVWLVQVIWWRSLVVVVVPVLALATYGLLRTDLPLASGFAVSQGALEEMRESGEAGVAGIYAIGSVEPGDHGMTFLEMEDLGGAFYAEAGFLHAPQGVFAESELMQYVEFGHIKGDWYWYNVPESTL
ncbi:hypothetical protein GCM10022221_51000 [Actinocorallia aurea]